MVLNWFSHSQASGALAPPGKISSILSGLLGAGNAAASSPTKHSTFDVSLVLAGLSVVAALGVTPYGLSSPIAGRVTGRAHRMDGLVFG